MTTETVVRRGRREKKVPVEKLQEQHLSGPADEPLEQIAREMKVDQVVPANFRPHYQKIVFRNQRDPGFPLEFHYASKTHPFKMYKLIDGDTYDLPVEVIMNLEGCREHVHKYRKNKDGLPEIYKAGFRSHFVCERVA